MTEQTISGERLTLSVTEGATAFGISERKLRELIASGDVPVVRVGRRVLLVRSQLDAWLRERAGRA